MVKKLSFMLLFFFMLVGCEKKKVEIVDIDTQPNVTQTTSQEEESEVLKKIKGSGILRFGMDSSELPWCMRDTKSGELIGYEVELNQLLVSKISEYLKTPLKMEIFIAKWETLPSNLIQQKFDIIGNAWSPTDETKDKILWSEPNLNWGLMVAVRPDEKLTSFKDFLNKTVGRYNDPTTKEFFIGIGFKKIRLLDDGNIGINSLIKGDIDAFIYDSVFLKYHVKADKNIKLLRDQLNNSSYNYGIRKDEKDLLDITNRALKEIKQSDAYREILKKWFD